MNCGRWPHLFLPWALGGSCLLEHVGDRGALFARLLEHVGDRLVRNVRDGSQVLYLFFSGAVGRRIVFVGCICLRFVLGMISNPQFGNSVAFFGVWDFREGWG